MNRIARAVLALGLSAGVACGGAGDRVATSRVSVVPPTPAPPAPPPEPAEVLPGVEALAGPVERLHNPGWLRTTLDLRVSAAAGTVVFDWFAPYATGDGHSVTFWTNVVEWRVERTQNGTTFHSFDLEWPADRELGLRFRSSADRGDGPPTLLCTSSNCTITP